MGNFHSWRCACTFFQQNGSQTHPFSSKQYASLSNSEVVEQVKKGLRLKVAEGTPMNFIPLFDKCWQEDPKNRPSFEFILEVLSKESETNIEEIIKTGVSCSQPQQAVYDDSQLVSSYF